ncbi:MAG: MFS transporter [Rhodoferax sp.]
MAEPAAKTHHLPAGVWALGLVSMLTDISTEMVSGLLPVFLITGLGASASLVGLIEGLAGATTMVVKVFSGSLSDYLGRRKPLVLGGYLLSALAKPLLAMAPGIGSIASARIMDRMGKGVRDAPRDALIADITHGSVRGAAFGLRQALDTMGAFIGPLLAMGLMLLWANDYRAVFWAAAIPSALAVVLMYLGVREPHRPKTLAAFNPLTRSNLAQLDAAYWWLVAVGATFTLARFSEAFLVLRAQQDGLPLAWTPLVLIAMNLVYATLAYPFGKFSDHANPKHLLGAGLLVLIAADVLLARGGAGIWGGIALWGLHMAMTQGLLSAMVAGAAPPHLRGTAYGLFYLVSGLALLAASALAGLLWDARGAPATFMAGALISALALLLLWFKPAFAARAH